MVKTEEMSQGRGSSLVNHGLPSMHEPLNCVLSTENELIIPFERVFTYR